jgi:flavodoxin I
MMMIFPSRVPLGTQVVQVLVVLTLAPPSMVIGFAPPRPQKMRSRSSCLSLEAAKVGIFFGTSTGSTETVAEMLAESLGDDAEGPFDVDALDGSVQDVFGRYDALIVGTPTWNTGADTERSGTGWDELYYGPMAKLNTLAGKKVAVFGLGDQVSYAENYADATGELHDVFENLGCKMMGYTSQEGYEHEASKSIRGEKFCGLLCDMVNQEELTEERVHNWIDQLTSEGFLEEGPVTVATAAKPASLALDDPVTVSPEIVKRLEDYSKILDESIELHSDNGYTPHFNPATRSTMWTSADGRSCYYTFDNKPKTIEKMVSP